MELHVELHLEDGTIIYSAGFLEYHAGDHWTMPHGARLLIVKIVEILLIDDEHAEEMQS